MFLKPIHICLDKESERGFSFKGGNNRDLTDQARTMLEVDMVKVSETQYIIYTCRYRLFSNT